MGQARYIAYYRVSTDRQGLSRLGLEAQRQSVQKHVASTGMLLAEFTEIESGKKNNRPTLQEALALCRREKATLLIAKLDRLGRNVAFIATLLDSGVDFIAADNPHANRLMIHLLAAFAEHEREQISIRTKQALQAAKARGTKLGEQAKPVEARNGYRADILADQLKPIIDELSGQGHRSLRAIAKELNDREIASSRGGIWYPSSVRNLVQRCLQDGLGHSNGHKM